MKLTLRSLGRSLASLALGVSVAVSVAGCPRAPEAPEPLSGTPCEQLTDCNPGRSCGALKLCSCTTEPCVDGFCEEGFSLLRPCREDGQPVRPPDP